MPRLVSAIKAMCETIDGRNLRDGTLVSTAAILRGDTAPFDVEAVSLRIRTDAMTVTKGSMASPTVSMLVSLSPSCD